MTVRVRYECGNYVRCELFVGPYWEEGGSLLKRGRNGLELFRRHANYCDTRFKDYFLVIYFQATLHYFDGGSVIIR